MTVRRATVDDLGAINEIYNHYVRSSPATFDLEPWTLDRRRAWLAEHADPRHPVLVATENGNVIGYAYSGLHRPRPAYDPSVEVSAYLAPDATGRGIGSALYECLFAALEGQDLHRALAGITLPNPASVALHERFGFRRVGVFSEQGRKFDRWWDVAWYEKAL